MTETGELSPAVRFVLLMRDRSRHFKRSNQKFDGAQQDALRLAIRGGLPFDLEDMAYLREHCRFTWHAGSNGNWGEPYYFDAVRYDNGSAARSFEKMKGRKPFIWRGEVGHGIDTIRTGGRLAVGSRFRCRGVGLAVTSFDDEAGCVIACSYRSRSEEERYEPEKVEHRYRLTRKDLKALADPTPGSPDLSDIHKLKKTAE